MTNIVIEGPDGTGKSTLAKKLVDLLPEFSYEASKGPPKGPVEIMKRAEDYLAMDNKIFDRHILVSQPIYGMVRGDSVTSVELFGLLDKLYSTDTIFVYCYHQMGSHVVKSHDTPDHLELINQHTQTIENLYRQWAQSRVPAELWYPMSSAEQIAQTIKERLRA